MSVSLRNILLIGTIVLPMKSWAQAEIGQVQGYIGTAIFPSQTNNDLMAGYSPGLTVGAGVSKTIKNAWVLNPNLEYTASSKTHYSFSLISISTSIKYYPWLFSKARPYVLALVNLSFMNLHQEAFQTTVQPDPAYSVSTPSDIPISEITYREPELKLQFAPTIGVGAGVGVDIPVKLKAIPFIQYSYTSYTSKSSSLLNSNFSNNTTGLATQNITVGLRYSIYPRLKK